MAVINTNLTCELQEAVKVQYLKGNLFSQDNQGNVINVSVFDGGEPVTLSGSVTANIIRPDGGTVTATGGTISGNVASITLPAAAYAIPGVVSIVVKLTASSVITTIAAVVATMYKSSTDTVVDPGTIIPSVQALVTQIETAVASIPADYSSLWTSLAPAFNSSSSYTAGQYVTYNGGLYVFTADHTGSWNASHVAATNIGGQLASLKSAIDAYGSVKDSNNYSWTIGVIINASGNQTSSSGFALSGSVNVKPGTCYINTNPATGYNGKTTALWINQYYSSNGSWKNRTKVQSNGIFCVDNDCNKIRIAYGYASDQSVTMTKAILDSEFSIKEIQECATKVELENESSEREKEDNNILQTLIENQDSDLRNIINWNNIKNETLMWDAGTETENEGYWFSNYMPVKANKTYITYNPITNTYPNIARVHAFDARKNYLEMLTVSDHEFTTPVNTAFIVFSCRYVHGGETGTYNSTPDWDDNIGKMYINIGTDGTKHAPYPDYLNDDISVYNILETDYSRVIRIADAIADNKSFIEINRSEFGAGSNISIVATGRNIFDGVLQTGYWNGSSVTPSDTHKASVNPIYVNDGEIIITNGNCRITEFRSDGTYNTSYLATARIPYKVSDNTNYFHVSAENAVMEAMCVYSGRSIPDVDIAYNGRTISHTVRDWGTTKYKVPITLFEGYCSVYVAKANSSNIKVGYNANTAKDQLMNNSNKTAISESMNFAGTKLAESKLFTAHRGSTIEAPENTLFAIVQAFKNGFKNVEIDVRFTSDGIPVLLHDSTIDRTSDGTGNVNSFTYSELQAYDFGSWMGKQYRNTRIPTLENAIRLCRTLNLKPHLDIAGMNQTETTITAICDILKKYGVLDGTTFYVRSINSGVGTIKSYYINAGAKCYIYYQASGFGESSIVTLLTNINNSYRVSDAIYDMGVSINVSDLTPLIKTTSAGFDKPVPIAIYFIDSYTDFAKVYDFPYALYCTNMGDIPFLSAQYFAPGSAY